MAPRAAARLETLGFGQVHEYRGGKLDWMAAGLPTEGENSLHPRAGDAARKDVPICSLTDRLGDVRDRVKAAGWDAALAVDGEGVVLGLLRSKELRSEERRVGKECRSRWVRPHEKENGGVAVRVRRTSPTIWF